MGKVHVECLNAWRALSANPNSFYHCDQVCTMHASFALPFLLTDVSVLVLARISICVHMHNSGEYGGRACGAHLTGSMLCICTFVVGRLGVML